MWSSASDGGRLRRRGVVATFVAVAVTAAASCSVAARAARGGPDRLPRQRRARRRAAGPRRPGRRRQGGPAGQAGSPAGPPGWAATWASPTASTPPCAAGWATPWSCGCAPTAPRTGSGRPSTPGTAPTGVRRRQAPSQRLQRGLALHPAPARRRTGGGTDDLQTFYVVQSSPNLVFHADSAARGVVPGPRPLRLARRLDRLPHRARARVPSTRCESVREHPIPRRNCATGGPGRRCRSRHRRGRERRSCPTPTRGPRRWPSPSPPARPRPTTRCRASSPGSGKHTRYSTDIPPLRARPGHRRRVPLREPHRVLRTDLDVAGGDAAVPRHPGPRGGRLRARALQPDHRPLRRPGQRRPRLGPGVVPAATDGRASIPPRWCRSPTSVPGRHPLLHDASGRCGGCRGCPSPSCVVGVGPGRRPGACAGGGPRTWAERAARNIEIAGRRAGRRRRPSETLAEYATALDDLAGDRSGTWRRWPRRGGERLRRPRAPPAAQRAMVAEAKRTRVRRRRQAAGVSSRI